MQNHLRRRELAQRLGISQLSLESMWQAGTGPNGLRVGMRRIIFPMAEIEAWEAMRLFSNSLAKLADGN
jgi:predicted DNA-binding transcriptional regulator AlpA